MDNNSERRYSNHQVRAAKPAEGVQFAEIEGVAALINSKTRIEGWDPYDEIIMPGAFDECLGDDIRCLFNHDEDKILARSQNGEGTLQVFINPDGHLAYKYTTPNRSYALDLQDAIEKGDVNQSSFQFRIKEQSWVWGDKSKGEVDLRKIMKVEKLYDVSPVTFPAYPDTSVAKRSYEEARQAERPDESYKLDLLTKELELKNRL